MKTTEEKNRMIAEFMGVNKNDNGTFELPQFGSLRPNGDFKTEFEINQLKYHTSWDLLVPVMKKAYSLSKELDPDKAFRISHITQNYQTAVINNEVSVAHHYVCDAINLLNENK